MEDTPPLPAALQTVLGSQPTRRAVRRVVDRCHRMAHAYLRQQRQAGALREDLLGEDVEDLAMDAIAGLFERDERGRFPELRRYFSDRSLTDASPAAVEEDLRRLVLSAVTDWLFEAYRAADRSLSNLIRNLKRVLNAREDVCVHRRGKTLWVDCQLTGADRDEGQGRPMPMDVLEAYLTGAVAEKPSTGELAEVALETLRDHPDYEAAVPLTRLAQVMRAARTRVQAVTEHEAPVSIPDHPLLQTDELESLLERVLAEVRDEKRATYVGAGTVDEETYAAYFRALRDRLDARFVPPGDPEMTHFDALSAHLPGLSRETYRAAHRARFEYLDQQVREALVDHLQEVV